MFIINLFGDGIRYWVCNLQEPVWEPLIAYKKTNSINWNELLMNISLLKRHGINDWSQLSIAPEKSGLVLNSSNKIEIKKGSRLMERFYSEELFVQKTLFPRFKTEFQEKEFVFKNQLIIAQYETGLIAKYQIDIESILIDDLTFTYQKPLFTNNEKILTTLKYKKNNLKRIKEDTVVRGLIVEKI